MNKTYYVLCDAELGLYTKTKTAKHAISECTDGVYTISTFKNKDRLNAHTERLEQRGYKQIQLLF